MNFSFGGGEGRWENKGDVEGRVSSPTVINLDGDPVIPPVSSQAASGITKCLEGLMR